MSREFCVAEVGTLESNPGFDEACRSAFARRGIDIDQFPPAIEEEYDAMEGRMITVAIVSVPDNYPVIG